MLLENHEISEPDEADSSVDFVSVSRESFKHPLCVFSPLGLSVDLVFVRHHRIRSYHQ